MLYDVDLKNELAGYIRQLETAVRVEKPDKERTAELITRAKGSRSMRQFAQEMGFNVSSISKVINLKTDSLSREFLAQAALHASEDSNVTLADLMDAQGLISRKEIPSNRKKLVVSYRRILADDLIQRGYSVSYESDDPSQNFYDFAFRTNALRADGSGRWLFSVKMLSERDKIAGSGRFDHLIKSFMAFYYCGGKADRISMVIDQPSIFEQIKENARKYQIPDQISVILISIDAGSAIDEYVFPLTEGKQAKLVFN